MSLTAKSLILDLLATVRRGAVPVRALLEAGALFDLAENAVRVALARLLQDGLVARDERGRYRLPPSAVGSRLRSWKEQVSRTRAWNGRWVAVHLAATPRLRSRAARDSGRALRLLGFRTLTPGLEVRPDNLSGGVGSVREDLEALGLQGSPTVFGLGDLSDADDERARGLWAGDALTNGYAETRRQLTESAARLGALPIGEARAESFRVGGAAIRQVVLDPLLPAPMGDPDALRALVDCMDDYDRLGRRLWSGWLGDGESRARAGGRSHPRAAPADVRALAAATTLPRPRDERKTA